MEEGGRRDWKEGSMKRLGPELLTLKVDRGAINQEKQATSRRGKEEDFPVGPANRSTSPLAS